MQGNWKSHTFMPHCHNDSAQCYDESLKHLLKWWKLILKNVKILK